MAITQTYGTQIKRLGKKCPEAMPWDKHPETIPLGQNFHGKSPWDNYPEGRNVLGDKKSLGTKCPRDKTSQGKTVFGDTKSRDKRPFVILKITCSTHCYYSNEKFCLHRKSAKICFAVANGKTVNIAQSQQIHREDSMAVGAQNTYTKKPRSSLCVVLIGFSGAKCGSHADDYLSAILPPPPFRGWWNFNFL